jgi:hypothetical protein
MRKLLFSMIVIACAASFSFAQGSDEYNKFEVYGGYSHARVDLGGGDREGFNGFEAAVTGNISRYFGLKGDYAYHRKTFTDAGISVTAQTHTFVGGVQIKDNSTETKFKPFVHALLGGTNAQASALGFTDSSNGFAGVFGGGLDVRASRHIDIRVVQADYVPTRLEGEWQHNFHVGVGIVIH